MKPYSGPDVTAVDIETVPLASSMAQPYPEDERTPPSNYGAEAKERWREKDRKDWETDRVKQYSLSPLYGRVAAIGLAHWDDDSQLIETAFTAPTEADEAPMLELFWKRSVQSDCLVTWNGIGFDIPFLMVRSAIHGIANPWGSTLLKRYSTTYHYDVRAVVNGWDLRAKGTLDEWLRAFGLPGKTGHGGDVYAMAQAGEWAAIGQYAGADAGRTLRLHEKVKRTFD